jgi:protein phosphatase 1 regulatory subunit 7
MRPQNRITNPEKIERLLIDKDLKDGKLVIVQFSEKLYSDKILNDLNEICLEYDDNFSVRFYGHYQDSFDCKTLLKLPNIKSLWLDSLLKAENLELISDLKKLKRLSLGVFELKETEIFQAKNLQNLKELIIGETKTKALNLKYLENYKDLNHLIICGHTKNIDAVGELSELEFLSLNSIKKVPINFINKLKNLKTLKFILGSRDNLDEIEENKIENLEIIWVRGFNDLYCITNFPKLKSLRIEDEIQLPKIHFANIFPDLTNLKIINCKILETIKGLENLPKLNSLVVYQTKVDFDNFMLQELPKELKHLGFYTTKSKVDKKIKKALENKGYICR